IDLGGGLSGLERFFIKPTQLHLSADALATLNAGLSIGFLHAGINNGTVSLDTEFNVNLVDPNGDGMISLAELQGTTISNLINIPDPLAEVHVDLPVSASLGDFGASAEIEIDAANLFDNPVPTFSFTPNTGDIQDLLNFNALSPASLIGLLQQLG